MIIKPISVGSTTVWARCINPEHEDKHPSLEIALVGEYEGRCYCHGCRKVWQLNKEDVEYLKSQTKPTTSGICEDVGKFYHQCWEAACADPQKSQPFNQRLCEEWTVSPLILQELGIFWWDSRFFIPMRGVSNEICGIQYRFLDGFKLCQHGSKLGIFATPGRLETEKPVFLTEGCSDLACLLDLGFQGIGRPNCNGGIELIIKYLEEHAKVSNKLIVVADNDIPGTEGAHQLCNAWNEWYASERTMTVWTPEAKDLREEIKIKGKEKVKQLLRELI